MFGVPMNRLILKGLGSVFNSTSYSTILNIHNLKRNISKNVDFNHWGCFEASMVPVLGSPRPL